MEEKGEILEAVAVEKNTSVIAPGICPASVVPVLSFAQLLLGAADASVHTELTSPCQ